MTNLQTGILFDASRYPAYHEAKKKSMKRGRYFLWTCGSIILVCYVGIIIVLLPANLEDIDSRYLTRFLGASIIPLWWLVGHFYASSLLKKHWAVPLRVTDRELKFSRRSIQLASLQIVGASKWGLVIIWKPENSRFRKHVELSLGEVGNADEFLSAIKAQNPQIEVQDVRRKKSR